MFPRSKTPTPSTMLRDLHAKPEVYWFRRGEHATVKLFHQMAARVPAYKDFLAQEHINPRKVKRIEDLRVVPPVDKDNYLRRYPLSDLCWDGDLRGQSWVVSTTSGSTGEPFYFPRQEEQDRQYALNAELYLRNNFQIHKKSTLYINGFAMGAWIGGLFTYQAIRYVAESGKYPLSIINPGIFKKEIIKSVKNLGKQFDQIIIGGYPPLIKDMIDVAIDEGLSWSDYNVGFIFSAEAFSEEFRDYVIEKASLANPYTSTLNHYGTVDLGTMAHETPLTVLIRRLLEQNQAAKVAVLPEPHRLPTIAQFFPEMFYFEEEDHNLYASARSGLPLCRYNLKDYGGIIRFEEMSAHLAAHHIHLDSELHEADLTSTRWNLPYVYVYERRDFVVKLYGANVYPESIKKTLQRDPFAADVSGKFTVTISFDNERNQYLDLNIELKNGREKPRFRSEMLQKAIINRLLKENSEYAVLHKEIPHRLVPQITYWRFEDPPYFTPGGKQRWVA